MYLEEVFHTLGVVAVRFTADALDLLDLSSFASGLDVLEMNLGVLAEVNNRAQKVEQSFEAL